MCVQKRHVSTVKSVGVSTGNVFMTPGRCDMRPYYRSVSAFQRWTCVDDVVGVVDHLTRDYEGGGGWYVVRGLCWSPPPFCLVPCLLYPSTRGRIRSAPEYRSSHVATSTDRYGSAYPCTETSGGYLHRRARAGVCRR